MMYRTAFYYIIAYLEKMLGGNSVSLITIIQFLIRITVSIRRKKIFFFEKQKSAAGYVNSNNLIFPEFNSSAEI